MNFRAYSAAAILTVALLAPAWAEEPQTQQPAAAAPAPAPQPEATPPAHPATPSQAVKDMAAPLTGHPAMQALEAPPEQPKPMKPITGRVVQTVNGGGYSYVYLKQKDGKKVWVALPEFKAVVGEQLTVEPQMEMQNFESKALNKKFDKLIFAGPPAEPKAGKGGKKAGKAPQRSPGSGGATVAVADEKIKVKKATGPNAYTIAELFKNRDKLNGKKVTVNGKAVKVSSGIMNRNWIHVQDGTGSHATQDNDLVVTSDAVPTVGDVITVKGVLIKNKDFGSGYKYNLIIEKAEIIIQ